MRRILVCLTILIVMCLAVGVASATSQAARRTQLDCATCHDGFPRLNSFGEKYMRAGYRLPGMEAVNDKSGEKKAPKRMVLETVSDYFGVRLNLDVVKWEDSAGENDEDSISFGTDNWTQFFVMGPIADKFSFFTEIEISTHGTHHSWWKLGWHPSKKANVVLGNQSPVDHSAFSNRLRILPAVKSAAYGLKVSDGMGVESVNASSARPGIQVHGEITENLIYYTGISNGRGHDADLINYWAGLRMYLPTDGAFEGSSASLTYYSGSDLSDDGPFAIENDYSWLMPAVNMRWNSLDVQVYGRLVTEDNRLFASAFPTPDRGVPTIESVDYDGWGATVGWMTANGLWQPAVQYDKIEDSAVTEEVETLVVALSYFMRDNMRVAGYYQSDLVDHADPADDNNKFFVNVRMMF
jgi:hypothetical protein